MRALYFISALFISTHTYSSELMHPRMHNEALHPKAHREGIPDRAAHAEGIHDRAHKEEKIKIVDGEIKEYEDILKRLKEDEDDASLREHYTEYKRLFEELRTKIEHNPSLDVKNEIALIHRRHNLFSDTSY